MKKIKLITLGIGSLLAASTSAVALVSCGTSEKNKDQNDDPISNDTYWTDINKADQPSEFPASEIGPAERKFPATPIGPSTPTAPATTDVTSNFKSGTWTMPSNPNYQRRYFVWADKDGKTSIPPVGDYILKFKTKDLSGTEFTFTYTLSIDAKTGMIAKSARIAGPDGQTNLLINYAGVDSNYPETSGQIYLDYYTSHSGEWWPYGADTTLESATQVDMTSPRLNAVDVKDYVGKIPAGNAYVFKSGKSFTPGKMYHLTINFILKENDNQITVPLTLNFTAPDEQNNRIYNESARIQVTSGICSINVYPNGLTSEGNIITLNAPGTFVTAKMVSLEEITI